MSKDFFRGKLKIELILCLILSFAAAVGLFFVLQATGEGLLDNYFSKSTYIEDQRKQVVNDFKQYVSDKHLTVYDEEEIARWVKNERYISLYMFVEDKLIFSSTENESEPGGSDILMSPLLMNKPLYDVPFNGTVAQTYIDSYFEYKYYFVVSFIGISIAFLFFIFVMLFFINRKTSYIAVLDKEIKILEGGELDYPITSRGKDELASLAQSINEMRKSFIERLDSEDKARNANSELVTAMSHDLRTPLTALIGYLDIIEYRKYKTDEHLMQYIHNSREKAYQIKQLSDKLFEYFTVSNLTEDHLELESYDGIQLLDQLLDDQLLILQNSGFQFQYIPSDRPFQLELNVISMRRVFDNIFSNITKYADKASSVIIKYQLRNQMLLISISNEISRTSRDITGTGIGVKTCTRIIEQHNGKLAITKGEHTYSIHISLPAALTPV
ncbi:HAMP domain-containing sensor histidine kinase [Paenibacillus sp. MMS20-IR301]|uniref:HAMP domain-containing sensor histidine kinase n=1 Tax=Paenibacillus sp. MMS20-IR301 TaxID=2895946 RepID=UPI0028F13088|nr:HAMP domain-containing sensor histidine kinase [Paenibacillus sp. MMS20-IR301]WNS45211.1 HAMP domain-containing sensor histidine kinase [Paenibacillus sp. MMS20-IR301]